MKEILDLPNVTGTNPCKIAEFHNKLSHSVQALETMKKLHEINGNVSMTLDKLADIREIWSEPILNGNRGTSSN